MTTQAQFARKRGVARKTVSGWASRGLVLLNRDGSVNVRESERLLAERPDTYRGGKVKSPARIGDEETSEDLAVPFTLAEAARRKENYAARTKQLEFEQRAGTLLRRDVVHEFMLAAFQRVRTRLLELPTTVAPIVITARTEAQAKAILEDRIREVLDELASGGPLPGAPIRKAA